MTAVRCYFCDTPIRKDQICSCEQAMEHRKRRQKEQNAAAEELLAKETAQRDHWRYTAAIAAMQGMIAVISWNKKVDEDGIYYEPPSEAIAYHAVDIADALLRKLEGGE